MYRETAGLVMYGQLGKDSILMKLGSLVEKMEHDDSYSREELVRAIYDEVYRLLDLSTTYGFDNNLWQCYIAYLLATTENPFSILCETVGASKDGTVNEIGTALINTGIAFGVISLGSGNGFARHLGFSQMMNKALKQILKSETTDIDVVEINGHYSLNVSGFGFDAEVAHFFSRMKIRGIFSYIYSIIHMWFRYPGKRYVFHIDGKTWEEDCFVLSVANSSQYGNNDSIAPKA